MTRSSAIWLTCLALVAGASAVPDAAQRPGSPVDLAQTLARAGQRLEQWYARAQSVVSTETVWIQPLRADLSPADFPRRLAFELRVGWDPDRSGPAGLPVANVLREPIRGNERSSPDREDPGCMDPKPVSPEPMAMLLPARLGESEFSNARTGQVDGRPALTLDYRGRAAVAAEIAWTDECVSVTLPGRSRGRIWIDAVTYDVLRMDDRLVGTFEFDVPREHVRRGAASSMVIERAESSIRYKRVEFQDPHETLMLPAAIDTLTVIRGGGIQRVRITQRFSDYRRFLTAGRVVN
ncbi:MAG: hypothetical protein HYX77_01495 [Acidobacteria bacterium]|nr:hypothetical protein [Acidobacteriota bacterium]